MIGWNFWGFCEFVICGWYEFKVLLWNWVFIWMWFFVFWFGKVDYDLFVVEFVVGVCVVWGWFVFNVGIGWECFGCECVGWEWCWWEWCWWECCWVFYCWVELVYRYGDCESVGRGGRKRFFG